jgi:hypothetical protein
LTRPGSDAGLFSRKSIRLSIGVALTVVAVAFVTYWFGRSMAPTAAEVSTCKKSTCGPLELVDCGTEFVGPLFVYVRFAGHYLGDCGSYAASLYNTTFCPVVGKVRSLCAQD